MGDYGGRDLRLSKARRGILKVDIGRERARDEHTGALRMRGGFSHCNRPDKRPLEVIS